MTQDVVLTSGGESLGGVGRGPLFRDSRGRFLHLNAIVSSALLLFDRNGEYLGGMERPGSGPGEFVDIRRVIVGEGDTLHLIDIGNGRLTTLTPALEFVRSSPLAVPQWDAVEVRPGLIMVSGHSRTFRFGYPLHPVRNGELGAPMGGTEALANSSRPTGFDAYRVLARESDSTFWAAHVPEYRFELWKTDDTLLRVLTGDPDWFEVADRRTLKGRINPLIRDLEIDEDGLFWVLTRARSANWEELAYEGPRATPDFPAILSRTGDTDDLLDSVIQVIDPHDGVILAAVRFDHPFRSFAGVRRVYSYDEDEAGQPRIIVWQLRLSEDQP